jgi:ankyrin repeat protein
MRLLIIVLVVGSHCYGMDCLLDGLRTCFCWCQDNEVKSVPYLVNEFHCCASDGNIKKIKKLIEGGLVKDLDIPDALGRTALYRAFINKKKEVFDYLIGRGADVNKVEIIARRIEERSKMVDEHVAEFRKSISVEVPSIPLHLQIREYVDRVVLDKSLKEAAEVP